MSYTNRLGRHRIFTLNLSVWIGANHDRTGSRLRRYALNLERVLLIGKIGSRSKVPRKAINRLHQKLEISKIANASTFRQEKRSLHAQGRLSKPILA